MSKRKKQKRTAEQTTPSRTLTDRGEQGRRLLLGFITILIVARPLVVGEDPGLLSDFSHPANHILTFLWLIAAAGWALWRYLAKQPSGKVGLVEGALLVTVVLVFVSAGAAGYKHAAWLIAWEWLIFLLALFLIRQLVRTDTDRRYILAAFLANVVSLSVYALYQHTVVVPRTEKSIEGLTQHVQKMHRKLQKQEAMIGALGGAPALPVAFLLTGDQTGAVERIGELLRERKQIYIEQNHARASFMYPASFANYLALLLPIMAFAGFAFYRKDPEDKRAWLVLLCLALGLGALWLTMSRGPFFVVLMLGLIAIGVRYRAVLWQKKAWLVVGVVVALGAIGGLLYLDRADFTEPQGGVPGRLQIWKASWSVVQQHPWMGVGPGNFQRHYLAEKPVQAVGHITEPHNFLLEMWASSGLFALLALLVALGLFMAKGSHMLRATEEPPGGEERKGLRWEFYGAGMLGLLLGYMLHEMSTAPAEALQPRIGMDAQSLFALAMIACGRSLVWFASFALFEHVPWSRRRMGMALWLGVVALIVSLLASGGISFPSVAQPLWICIGLGLTLLAPSETETKAEPRPMEAMAALPVLAGFAFAYFLYVLIPVARSNSLAVDAMQSARAYQEQGEARLRSVKARVAYLYNQVARPLSEAVTKQDTGNSIRRIQLARAFREVWALSLSTDLATVQKSHYFQAALANLVGARDLDPRNVDAIRNQSELHLLIARWVVDPDDRLEQYKRAVSLLKQAIDLDPTSPHLYYQMAVLYRETGEMDLAGTAARKALELHKEAPPGRRLSAEQKKRANRWKL